ncbi:MAG: redoxin domain-containing protein [Planctomycetota bacterium]
MRNGMLFFCFVGSLLFFPQWTHGKDDPSDGTNVIGKKIDDFTLRDFRGKSLSLRELGDKKAVVVAFLGVECPLARLYGRKLGELAREWAPRGVVFIAIDSNQQDSIPELADFARDHQIEFPLLKDPGNEIADRFGARRTPEVFVLDANHVIRYGGRVDDQYGIGIQKPKPTRQDLVSAVEEVLEGKAVSRPTTDVAGCFIGKVRKPNPKGTITYTRHVARILQERCVECHRAGEVAPFPLTNYEEVVGWAETIGEVVDEGRMPPWFASPEHGKFLNEGRIPDEEKRVLREWVANGCPEGDRKDLPEPREYTVGWGMPDPDAVYAMSDTPFIVPAEGVIEYQNYTVDPKWTEDKWISGAEARPGNRSVVHHILVFIRRPKKIYHPMLPGELVSAYAPGMKPTVAHADDMAVLAPAGSKIVFQVHYTPNGTEQRDISQVGFRFRDPKDVKMEIKAGMAINIFFKIPPRNENYPVTASHVFTEDSLLLGVNPHMHLRGKSFRYEAIYPDGRKEIVMDCPRYDFNWQLGYQFAEPLPMPKGTQILCTAHFDNSENNPSNPDPERAVRFGEQTWEEMMIGWFFSAEKRKD